MYTFKLPVWRDIVYCREALRKGLLTTVFWLQLRVASMSHLCGTMIWFNGADPLSPKRVLGGRKEHRACFTSMRLVSLAIEKIHLTGREFVCR